MPVFVPFLVLVAPGLVETGRRTWGWLRGGALSSLGSLGASALGASSFVGPLPADWARWNGARPELRGAPANTILDYAGIEKTSPAFRAALLDTAESLGIPVDSLALIMSHESGFDPKAKNPLPAAGLIQITQGANLPGYATKEAILSVLDMSGEEQLKKIVIPYYQRFGDKLAGANPGKVLMANFLPGKMGGDESTVLGVKDDPGFPGKIYGWNPGMDHNHDGQITIGDVYADAASVAKRAGGKRIRIDGSIWSPDDASAAPGGAAVSTMVTSAQKRPEKASAPVQGSKPAPALPAASSGGAGPRPSSASSGGITLAAVMDGSAVLPETVNLTLPSGLTVALMVDAIATPWEGSGYIRFPVSYADTIAICNKIDCLPLTKEISDLAWKTCNVHLEPVPLVSTAADAAKMATVEFSLKHDLSIVNPAKNSTGQAVNFGAWQTDVGKDWILDPGIAQSGAVNYGWRTLAGMPLQPVGHQHNAQHFDYSQVCRLIRRTGTYQGKTVNLLDRPELWLPAGFPAALLAPFKV